MECVKDNLLSKYFSSFGYIVAVSQLPALVIFAAYAGHLRTSERRTFRCPSSPKSRDDCLGKYDEHHNSPFPLYGFVLLCFVPLLAVCIAYSWCFVKSRVDELETALKADSENPRPRPRVTTRRVFHFYLLHLLVRLALGILFVVLQKFVFYPENFPTEFICIVNSTVLNTTKHDASATINCDNSVGSDNATCAGGIWIVNILLAVLVFAELCYLLVQAKRSERTTLDSEFCRKYFFNRSRTPVTLREHTLRMKSRVRNETEFLEPSIAQPENNRRNRLKLDDIFVDLVIYTGRAEHEFKDLSNRHEIFDIYLKPQHGALPIENLEELFLPNEDTQHPQKILVVGRPGIGKSLLCTKLSRDWSERGLFRDSTSNKNFEHLFLFQFRWFNTERTEKISLKQLISLLCPEGDTDNGVFQYMLDNPERVLLVFDGLDEFMHHENCLKEEQAQGPNGPTELMPFSALYVKLVKGNQLPGATVLTTCRPNVVQSLARLHFDRRVEIMGFTPQKVEQYVHKFLACPCSRRSGELVRRKSGKKKRGLLRFCLPQQPENLEQANKICAYNTVAVKRIWEHISGNLELLSLCYIPVNSHIVCSFLKKLISLEDQDSGNTALPTTSTQVYEGALRLFIFKHHPEFKGKLLTKEFLMGNAGFSDSVEETLTQVGSLAKTGIEERRLVFDSTEVRGIENCGLLNRIPDSEITWLQFRSHFCFIHLTFQELLAAREITKMDPNDLSHFITLNASDPKWHMVIQFVAGLLCGQENEAVNIFVSLLHQSLTRYPGSQKTETLLLMRCLHEYNDEAVVEKAASELQKDCNFSNRIDLSFCGVTPADCIAIAFFIKHLHKCTALNFASNSIADQGVLHLCDALKDVNCKLTQLDLAANSITDQGVLHLCDALKDVNCKLTQLELRGNSITGQGVLHLCDALKDVNCKLTQLDLTGNSITEQGVLHLCDALKDVNCKLTQLDLGNNRITDQSVLHLCDALKDVNCKLTQLELRFNGITDQGVLHLCDALKDVNCKLTQLELRFNGITDQGVLHLCDALKDVNCKLTQLDLAANSITDQRVLHLCDALKDVNCKLTQLNLGNYSLTDQGVLHLCDALKDVNCKLTQLELRDNSITDQGVLHLCDALKDVNCKLTQLDLRDNSITDQGVLHLCDALKDVNCKLTQLDLRLNSITDQSVLHLCDALKDVNCKLTQLYLIDSNITEQGLLHLCDALKDVNCKLKNIFS